MKPVIWISFSLLCLMAAGSLNPLLAVDEQRQAYDKMVKEATQEADEYVQEKQKEIQEAVDEGQSKQDAALDARIQAEQVRIEAEMDAIRNRGLGSGFSQGMKDDLLRQQQEKLDQLMSDPEAYFGG